MTDYKVHRIQFVEFLPKAINSAAVSEKLARVALSREDGSIEIRDPTNDWIIDRVIPGQEGRTVEHVVWLNQRLFTGGLNGEIIEWDLERLQPLYTQDSYGGPVWCLKFSFSGKYLAAGCEDGSIRVFEVGDSSISYERSLHKQEHRILSLAWSYDNNFIVSGGFDCTLRMYSVKTGAIISRMTSDNLKEGNTMIWSVEILKDMTIVAGDSLGNTQFWDGNSGTLLQSYHSHQADVLAVVVCNQEQTVYSTGVDSKVVQFNLVQVEQRLKWIQSKGVRATNHDTRTLAVYNGSLLSGGLDPRFVVYPLENFSSQSFVRYSCLPLPNALQLSHHRNLLCFREQQKLHVWSLKNPEDDATQRRKLFEICNDSADHLICSAISSNGKYLAYSSTAKCRALELHLDPPSVKKLSHVKMQPSTGMCITPSEEYIVTVGFEAVVSLIHLQSGRNTKLKFPDETLVQLPFRYIRVDHDSKYICVVDADSQCYIFSIADKGFVLELPKMNGQVTFCSFQPHTNNVFFATSEKFMYEFDISEKKFKPWLFDVNKSQIITNMGRLKDKINAVVFNPKVENEMFVQTKEVFGKIIYDSLLPASGMQKKNLKRKKGGKVLKTNGQFSNMMFFDINMAGDLVIVERPMSIVLENLPSTLKIKKFGS